MLDFSDIKSFVVDYEEVGEVISVPGNNMPFDLGVDNAFLLLHTSEDDLMNNSVQIRIKKLDPQAELPVHANQNDAGGDLVALEDPEVKYDDYGIAYIQYRTGISIEPPPGYHTEIFPRSSVSKYDLMLANSIGLVDEGYRGELLCRFKPTRDLPLEKLKIYKKGDRIAQLVVRRTHAPEFVEVEELGDSSRGEGGFGSTGT